MMKERTAYDNLPAKQLSPEVPQRNTRDLLSWNPLAPRPVQDRRASEYA